MNKTSIPNENDILSTIFALMDIFPERKSDFYIEKTARHCGVKYSAVIQSLDENRKKIVDRIQGEEK